MLSPKQKRRMKAKRARIFRRAMRGGRITPKQFEIVAKTLEAMFPHVLISRTKNSITITAQPWGDTLTWGQL